MISKILAASLALAANSATASDADLEQCFAAQTALVPFSGSVLIKTGQSTYAHASGTWDGDDRQPITSDTRFRLGSVQKVLTRVAIGRLVDAGKIELDAPVGSYIEGLPADMAAVTVDQLLEHRAGVASFTRMTPPAMDAMVSARTARDLLPLIVSEPLAFAPGSQEEYSNGGYWLLGVVIEAVSGVSYADFLAREITGPLGMTSTNLVSGDDTAIRKTRMGPPGQPPMAEPRATRFPREPNGTPSGDGVSTANDMAKLGAALLGSQLVSDATKAKLFPRRGDGAWRIGQSGGSLGTSTDFAVFPETGIVSVVLSNYDPPSGDLLGRVLRDAAVTGRCTPTRPEESGPRRGPPPPRA